MPKSPMRKKQCKACPWRKDVVPERDIPNGYCAKKHANLKSTIAEPGEFRPDDTIRMMACHETTGGREAPCVGWLVNQLGDGNNIMLRLVALRDKRFGALQTVGEQHERFEDTVPKS